MNRRGQSLIEATLVMLVFFALLFGVIDCGQVMYSRQALQDRVQSAVRYASLHPYDGTGEQVANLILYGELTASQKPAFLDLTRGNIQVRSTGDLLTVAIVNYDSHFFSPWLRQIVSPRPIVVSAPMATGAK